MITLVFRGTPVTCAKNVVDLLNAAEQDLDLRKVRIGNDMLVNAKLYNDIRSRWLTLLPYIAPAKEVRYAGHSLGACHAICSVALTPRSVVPHVFAFGPFQFANAKFLTACFGGRPAPRLYGRAKDFAPGWDHLDLATAQAGVVCHLLGGGKVEPVTQWPIWDDVVGDHDVDKYAADLEQVPGEKEAYTMCRLSSAVYLTDINDVIDQFDGVGFNVIDYIDAPGFRCVVAEES